LSNFRRFSESLSSPAKRSACTPRVGLLIHPELHRIPKRERDAALEESRATDVGGIELLGMAFGLRMTAGVTCQVAPDRVAQRIRISTAATSPYQLCISCSLMP